MERLTVKWKDNLYDTLDPIDVVDNEYSKINYEKVLTKLGKYEDAEEQGLLLRLPCKVGDTVYIIHDKNVYRAIATSVIAYQGKPLIRIYTRFDIIDVFYSDGRTTEYRAFGDLGTDVFLTKSEAEQALAEMKGE